MLPRTMIEEGTNPAKPQRNNITELNTQNLQMYTDFSDARRVFGQCFYPP